MAQSAPSNPSVTAPSSDSTSKDVGGGVGSDLHPVIRIGTKQSVFDNQPKLWVDKSFLNPQLRINPWQPFCVWSPCTGESAPTPSSSSSTAADLVITTGQVDGKLVSTKFKRSGSQSIKASSNSRHVISEVLLREKHRVVAVSVAPTKPFIAAICDGCLFILSNDLSRFDASGPAIITRPVKKCSPAIAFDDRYLYFLTDGNKHLNMVPLAELLLATKALLPEADGKISRPFDLEPLVQTVTCCWSHNLLQLSQFDITAMSASCSVLAIVHTRGFIVLDLKRPMAANIIHKADHDGSVPSMVTIMQGGIVAVANHPQLLIGLNSQFASKWETVDDKKRSMKRDEDESVEDCIVFLQPPPVSRDIDKPEDLLRNCQISCVRYAGTGSCIKGMAAVGPMMFVMLSEKESSGGGMAAGGASSSMNTGSSSSQGCFLDICVPTSGLSLRHHKEHRKTDTTKRLRGLMGKQFNGFQLKWIASAGSCLACIDGYAHGDITLVDPDPAFFEDISDAQLYQEAQNQALPPIVDGTCEWDQLGVQEPQLNDHWWKTLCWEIRRPSHSEQQRLRHLCTVKPLELGPLSGIPPVDASHVAASCFRTVTHNSWELVLRQDETIEARALRAAALTSSSSSSSSSSQISVLDSASSASPPASLNPWDKLISDCARSTTKSVVENKSDYEKLDLAFGRSSPSLNPGCMTPASDDDRVKRAREIMSTGSKKKEKIGLAMADHASGPCARFFQMHLSLSRISLSQSIGLNALPLSVSVCLYSHNGSRITPNYEADRRREDPFGAQNAFGGTCVFANIVGDDLRNQAAPKFVIAAFRFCCHFRGDTKTTNKTYLEQPSHSVRQLTHTLCRNQRALKLCLLRSRLTFCCRCHKLYENGRTATMNWRA